MAHEDRFERASKLSVYWRNCATDLYGSAAALWVSTDPDVEKEILRRSGLAELDPGFRMGAATPGVFLMLCGLSLELLFKAVLIARRQNVPKKHDLVKLATLAEVTFTEKERGLLGILTGAILWLGRYPIPKNRGEWEGEFDLIWKHLWEPTSPGSPIRERTHALSWTGFNRLWSKVFAAYAKASKLETED